LSIRIQPWNELEAKLLRLALDSAAEPGEVTNAAEALVNSWRSRGLSPEILLGSELAKRLELSRAQGAIAASEFIMPFGKCRGLPLGRIKRSYLRWILRNCDNLQPSLTRAIQNVLSGDY
jgi:uncharacterized protein (DUF3820 family)